MKLPYNSIGTVSVFLMLFPSFFCYFFTEKSHDTAHGVRLSGNDQFTVFAMNIAEKLVFAYKPYRPDDQCSIPYPLKNIFVYSLVALSNTDQNNNSHLFKFVQVAEDITTENVILSIFTVNKSNCGTYDLSFFTVRYYEHQEYMFLKVHPSQKLVYLFADSFILSFDIDHLKVSEIANMTTIVPTSIFRTHAVDITDSYAILVGYFVNPSMKETAWSLAILFTLNPIQMIYFADIAVGYVQISSQAINYNSDLEMSISINPHRHITLIGLPVLNRVILLSTNTTSFNHKEWTMELIRTEVSQQEFTGFGRSVAWIDNTTVAISVLKVPNRRWSQSEVWIFNVDEPFKIPDFVFPNNQQQIIELSSSLFLQMFFSSGNLLLFTANRWVLLIPSGPPGFSSVWNYYQSANILVFNSTPCLPGTYKNTSNFGPCIVCPSQTKNTGNEPSIKCESCASTSFCPLGSVNDVSLETYPSYTQTFSYPDPPDMNNFDDLLIQNIFTINHLRRCIVVSPLFWTIIVIVLCLIIWLFMSLSKIWNCPKGNSHRNKAKEFLKKADILNEGERWIGGLFSFAILLLFAFTFWFASEFLKLYPLEISPKSYASCDDTVRNTVFNSALQLPLPNLDGNQWAIFEMLDAQPFTMIVDLLNTAADCSSVTVQQNRPGVNYLYLRNKSCIVQPDNATLSTSFFLPGHRTNVQINVTGPFFIGGMRLCLKSTGHVDGVHTLQTLDMCQLFLTKNETLSRTTTLNIVLIKVINVTKPLKIGGETHYHGRWAPTFSEGSLSDELIYEQDGQYLRYASERTTLSISLSEQPFFLQNNQQPMVRRDELAFHTLLFCILIIELFGMGFLIFRLIILPLIRSIVGCLHHKEKNESMEEAPVPSRMVVISTVEIERLDVDKIDKM